MTIYEDIANAADLGKPSARKTGRNPQWPYVPVLLIRTGVGDERYQHQIKGLAYATREEAVARAQRSIDAERALLAKKLAKPEYRALREQYGLPRELV